MRRFVLSLDVKMHLLCQSCSSSSWTIVSDVPFTGVVFYDVVGEIQKCYCKKRA